MKVIDCSSSSTQSDQPSSLSRSQAAIKLGYSRLSEEDAANYCIGSLGEVLGDKFILLRNVSLSDLEIAIPLILIGPGGLYVILTTNLIGSFRAKADAFLSLQNIKNPKPVQPNLLVRANLMARAVDVFLSKKKVNTFKAQSVLMCANPHMFVESMQPITQVVMSDTIKLFAGNLVKESPLIGPLIQQEIVDALMPVKPVEVFSKPEAQKFASAKTADAPFDARDYEPKRGTGGHKFNFNFSKGQLVILILLALFEIAALTIIVLLTVRGLVL